MTWGLRVPSPFLSCLIELDPLNREPILTFLVLYRAVIDLVNRFIRCWDATLIAGLRRHLKVLVAALLRVSHVVVLCPRLR